MGSYKNIYDEGKQAFADGKLRGHNPYPKGKVDSVRWQMGWLDAEAEDDFMGKWFARANSGD